MNKIMIVDDEKHVLRILRISLEKHGYQVVTHNNGLDALEALENYQPDILITDIQMPRMSGEELCHQIVNKYPERKFLIYVLTSRTEVEHRDWSSQIDNLEFMEKPVSIRNLLNQLEKHFSEQQ